MDRLYKHAAEVKWFVYYTSPKAEKRIYRELVDSGYETYLPLRKSFKIWKNRQRKWIEEPLFPSYIFVKIHPAFIFDLLKVYGICMFITLGGKPCAIPDKDIEAIQRMIASEQEISANIAFKEGERVCIIRGPLIGYEGILFNQKGKNKFGIQLQGVNLNVAIDVSIEDIHKLTV